MLGRLFGRGSAGDRHDVSAWATRTGLTYSTGTDGLFRYLRGNPYDAGYGAGIQHVATGDRDGVRVVVMVFATRLASGDAGAPAVTMALSLPAAVPELTIRPRRTADGTLGHDIQLESADFNKKFWITSDNPQFAYAVLDPTMMEFLLGDENAEKYHIRYDGPMLVISHNDHLKDVAELEAMLELGKELIGRTARFVFESAWTIGPDQTRTRLTDIPADAFGEGQVNALHRQRTVEFRGRHIDQADHIMESRGMRDWFTVVSYDPPKPWPTIMISPREFIAAQSALHQDARYTDEVPTGDAEFDKVFAVGSHRPDFVHTVLNPAMTAWMLQDQRTRTVEIIFLNGILRPGRDNVTEVTNIGRLAVSGLGTLTDPGRPEELTTLLCDLLDQLDPAAYEVHVNPPVNL